MINRQIFEITSKYAGSFFSGGVSEGVIKKYREILGVSLSKSYTRFLKEFGEGGFGDFSVLGIESETYSGMVRKTMEFRDKINLKPCYVVVWQKRTRELNYLACLDTSRMVDGECPVIKYDLLTNTIEEYQPTFDDAFNDCVLDVYNRRVVPRLAEEPSVSELPAGLGYKSCWMTVIGCNQNEIVNALKLKNPVVMDYMVALELIKGQSGKVMVTADFDNRNYVIFYGGDFLFDLESVKKRTEGLPLVYGYLTHRVGETHGFFMSAEGEIVRLYYQDEEQIISIGSQLPKEKEKKIKLPPTIEDAKDKKKNWTRMDENVIMMLAEENSSVKTGTYPYAPVIVADL